MDAGTSEPSMPALGPHHNTSPADPDLKIFVRPHPKTQMPVLFSSAPTPVTSDIEPYRPFSTKEDFEFADICVRNNVKNEVIDSLLQQHARIPTSPITLKNHQELFQILDRAPNAPMCQRSGLLSE
ncbi:uncharacterized protein EI90DRAFT_3134822 [Cantharellus anzutake]|uniref:uncharacterized protein n=1 Tax=Cantharellus anzutake TaxID=1750568 RepID=UPI0019051F25|nr:uncharacterized protein EI90DRAFT_3134822 [Cantharellus anzutake]KAF8315986.1 hypothetical protein EI90DRAFT_3134822 [Cantharellus anzutake]